MKAISWYHQLRICSANPATEHSQKSSKKLLRNLPCHGNDSSMPFRTPLTLAELQHGRSSPVAAAANALTTPPVVLQLPRQGTVALLRAGKLRKSPTYKARQ